MRNLLTVIAGRVSPISNESLQPSIQLSLVAPVKTWPEILEFLEDTKLNCDCITKGQLELKIKYF